MGLSQQYRRAYQENGYVVAPGIVPNEALEPVRQAIAETVDQLARQRHAAGEIDQLYADAPFERRLAYVYQNATNKSMGWNREVFSRRFTTCSPTPICLNWPKACLAPKSPSTAITGCAPSCPASG
jgi:hypothetical protein